MSVVNIIDRVTEWAREEICKPVKLKCPPDDSENIANDAGYEYKLVTPACFALYVPTKEKLPPSIMSTFPSVAIRIMEGSDSLDGSGGNIKLEMVFSTWDTGTHGKDMLLPIKGMPGEFLKMSDDEASTYFERNSDGWRDAWNWVDTALRALESTTNINGYEIDRKTPIKFGPITEQEAIVDFYPFWFAWVSFAINYPIQRSIKEFEKFL